MRKRKGRNTALFLVFCMLLSMMSAISARAAWDDERYDFYGLLAADFLESYWDEEANCEKLLVTEDGYPAFANWTGGDVPEVGDEASYTDQKEACITGSYLWLVYKESVDGEKTNVTTGDITEVEYSVSDRDSANWETISKEGLISDDTFNTTNDDETTLVLFKPDKVGYYRFTYKDSGKENEKLIVHADYPEIGFYSAPDRTEKNFCPVDSYFYDNSVNYDELIENDKLDKPNEIYVNLYKKDPNVESIELSNLVVNDPSNEELSRLEFNEGETTATSEYMSVEKVSEGWYKITFEKALYSKEGFNLQVCTQKFYKGEDGTPQEEEYPPDAWLAGSFPRSGLLTLDWLDTYEQDGCEKILVGDDGHPLYHDGWNDETDLPIPGAPVEYADWRNGSSISISDPALWIDYIDFASGDKTHILAGDIDKVEYSENNPDEESAVWTEKKGLIENYSVQASDGKGRDLVLFKPDEPGYYRFTYNEDELIVRVEFPEVGFYSAQDLTKDNLYLTDGRFWDGGVSGYTGLIDENNQSTIYVNLNKDRYNADHIELTGYTLTFWEWNEEDNEDVEVRLDSADSENGISQYMSVEPVDDGSDWYEITFKEPLISKGNFSLDIAGERIYINEAGEEEQGGGTNASLNGSFRQSGLLYVTCDGEDLYSGEDWLSYAGGIAPGEVELRFGNFTKDEKTGKIKEEDLDLNDLNEETFTIEAQRFGEEEADFHKAIQGEDCTYEVTADGTLKIMSYYQQLYRITINGKSVYTHPYLNLIEFFGTPKRPDDPEKIENHICTTANVNEGKTDTIYVMPYVNDDDPGAVDMTTLEIVAKPSKDEQSVENYIEIDDVKDGDDSTTIGKKITITDEAKENFDITVTAKQNNEDEAPSATLSVKINKRSSLKVATAPKKTTYTEGEKFDPTGMAVELVYEDKTTDPVKIEDCTITPKGALTTKDTSVTVEYLGLKATQKITVKAKQQPTTEQPTTQQPTTQAAQPSTEGTVLSSQETGEKAEFTVTSDNGANPTVAYKKTTDKKEKTVKIPNTVEVNGVTYKVTSIADNAFKGNKTITKVTVGSNITSIGKNAFANCTKLKSITIPKNVTTVGDNAFKGCTALTKVTLPAKTKKVGKNAFYGCKKISKVTFKGTSVTKIGDGAFRKCSALKSVTIPKNVTEIGKDAFRDCKKLKTVSIKGTKLKKIGKNVFKNLPKNVTIKVPKKKKAAYKKLLKKAGYKGKVK